VTTDLQSGLAPGSARQGRDSDQHEEVLRVEGVSKRFGALQALQDVTFDLRNQEILAVVGANGAGKSTLMKVLAGVHKADAGTIFVDGHPVDITSVKSSQALGIEVVYQDLGLVPNMDVPFNLFLGRTPTRMGLFVQTRKMRERTRQVLDHLHIKGLQDLSVSVDNLSGGQRQALAIGRTLVWDRRIVILDEPAAALGVEETNEVLKLIEELRQRGSSVMVVTHNMDHVFSLADRVLVMRDGRSVRQSAISELDADQLVQAIMLGTV